MIIDIDKIYNPPAVIKRPQSNTTANNEQSSLNDTFDQQASRDYYSNYFRRDLIVFKNFDLFRSTDLVAAMIMIYAIITPLLVPGKTGIVIAIVQAFFWRAIHSLGNGVLLRSQSNNKFFTRHFIKWGGDVQEAFRNWKR
jgi:phosphatidylethanolamine N-methyltransferase